MGLSNGLHNVPVRIDDDQSSLAPPPFNNNNNNLWLVGYRRLVYRLRASA